jgi:hypothetical protein
MTTKKQRRLNAALLRKTMEDKINAQSAVTAGHDPMAAEKETENENTAANSAELAPNYSFGEAVMGPNVPEPKEHDPY